MNPTLFHLLADDHRNRLTTQRTVRTRRPRRGGVSRHLAARIRVGVGGALVTIGTRLAGPRTGPVGLHQPPT